MVFCPLVGVVLIRLVNAHSVTPEQQAMVNEAVFEFNVETFKINKRRKTYAPPLHRTIHRSTGTSKKSHYHHLADGIHLSEDQKDKCTDNPMNSKVSQ